MPTLWPLSSVLVLLGATYWAQRFLNSRQGRLPPGPPGLPIVGSLLQWPKVKPWITFAHWANLYGDITHAHILGQPVLIVNTPRAAHELLVKRGVVYADRPVKTMLELAGLGRSFGTSPANSRYQRMRALFNQTFGTQARVARFAALLERQSRKMLLRLFEQNMNLKQAIEKSTAASIMEITYGYEVKEEGEDPMVKMAIDLLALFGTIVSPKPYLVDIFPVLRFLPSWFPGARFHKIARDCRERYDTATKVPIEIVRQEIARGVARPSFATEHLGDGTRLDPEHYDAMVWTSIAMFGAGFDTVTSTIHSFFLCMVLHPQVQAHAQAELDAVIGPDRLPTLADRDHLPYVNALVKEVLRWAPAGPLGVPHRLREDDVYEGYYIPKGTNVVANIWALLHDPTTYPDPMAFNPSRFLDEKDHTPERDPEDFCFGFGRRICPGMILASANVFLTCATVLATFNIRKAKDTDGVDIEPVVDYSTGMVSHPAEFPCSIVPRSQAAEALAKAVAL